MEIKNFILKSGFFEYKIKEFNEETSTDEIKTWAAYLRILRSLWPASEIHLIYDFLKEFVPKLFNMIFQKMRKFIP